MKVVVDTSILLGNLRGFRPGNDLKLLMAAALGGQFELVVPHIVVDETVNKRREYAENAERKLRLAQADLAAVGVIFEAPAIDIEAATADFRRRLTGLLLNARTNVISLPEIGHEQVVRRALERRKPFAANGSGYRDALIWETVLALLREGDDVIVFLTANTRDFADPNDLTVLAADLLADLRDAQADDRVRLVPAIAAFAAEFVSAEAVLADELERRLEPESFLRDRLFEVLKDGLLSHVFDPLDISDPDDAIEGHVFDLPGLVISTEVLGATVETVEGLRGPWVRSATAIEGGTLMTLEAEVQAGVDVDVEVQWLGDPLDPRDPSGRERRRSVEHVWTDRTLLATAEATFRPEAGQFEDLFVIHVQF